MLDRGSVFRRLLDIVFIREEKGREKKRRLWKGAELDLGSI